MASHGGNGFERKLDVLETDLKDLKQLMAGQLQEIDNRSQNFVSISSGSWSVCSSRSATKTRSWYGKWRAWKQRTKPRRVGLLLKQKLQILYATTTRK